MVEPITVAQAKQVRLGYHTNNPRPFGSCMAQQGLRSAFPHTAEAPFLAPSRQRHARPSRPSWLAATFNLADNDQALSPMRLDHITAAYARVFSTPAFPARPRAHLSSTHLCHPGTPHTAMHGPCLVDRVRKLRSSTPARPFHQPQPFA